MKAYRLLRLSSFPRSFSAYSKSERIVLHKNFNIFLSCLLEWISFHSQEFVFQKTKKTLRLPDTACERRRRRRWWETVFRKVCGNLICSATIWWEASDRSECRNEKKQFLFQAISRSSPSKARHITSTWSCRLKWMETISHFFKLIKSIGPLFAEIYSIFTFTGLGRSAHTVIQRWFATGHNESLIKTVIWCKTF